MKVAIFSNDDLTSNLIFAPLFDVPGIEIVALKFAAGPHGRARSMIGGALELLKRTALRYWLYLVLSNGLFKLFEALTRTLRLSPRRGFLISMKRMAQKQNLPYEVVSDFNAADIATGLREKGVDLLIIRIGTILKRELLAVPNRGTWCVHSSLLPSFKGIAGEFHALCFADALIGSTVFKVAPKLDEGPPLGQIKIQRHEDRSLFYHMISNNRAAGELLARLVEDMAAGTDTRGHLLNKGLEPSYFSWPNSSKVNIFRSRGKRLMTVRELFNFAAGCIRVRAPRQDH